jgi:hypothetical protein
VVRIQQEGKSVSHACMHACFMFYSVCVCVCVCACVFSRRRRGTIVLSKLMCGGRRPKRVEGWGRE